MEDNKILLKQLEINKLKKDIENYKKRVEQLEKENRSAGITQKTFDNLVKANTLLVDENNSLKKEIEFLKIDKVRKKQAIQMFSKINLDDKYGEIKIIKLIPIYQTLTGEYND